MQPDGREISRLEACPDRRRRLRPISTGWTIMRSRERGKQIKKRHWTWKQSSSHATTFEKQVRSKRTNDSERHRKTPGISGRMQWSLHISRPGATKLV
ncbi:hypothetical protein BP00DRAFT_231953 [Aspergillus indologenus CBS 114.80]|uniref:Uncharacterized protein n=1 Tax=Aspergillus indologenus CBS 114.80 TaxID=1450541 RepID=A0A2V5I0D2_9EURO|nr:hypothetical protein BP00DRAFT_231953 [Aspergillus indologenus CBS 114.80]